VISSRYRLVGDDRFLKSMAQAERIVFLPLPDILHLSVT
jgi:hypothetical protein